MPVVEIVSKTCRDCYRCLRKCPVHAITVQEGHARVVAERCLYCGQCVRECPRRAIRVRGGVAAVKEMIASGTPVIASVALMESARIRPVVAEMMPALLRLGFAGAEATTRALRVVWSRYRQIARERGSYVIASGCPSVVALVERYHPEALASLAPIVSHAEAHARMIKARARSRGLGEVKVVHIGPEPASKGELLHSPGGDALDAAITFHEFRQWRAHEEAPAPRADAEAAPRKPKRALRMDDAGPPLEWVRDILPVYGVDECVEFLKSSRRIAPGTVVEMATCRYGCAIGSPRLLARVPEASAFLYPKDSPLAPDGIEEGADLDLSRTFVNRHTTRPQPTEEQIAKTLARIGVASREDELNCGACGYDRCRELAAAVFDGMAEVEMCMPFMRRQAHRISLIMQYTANGVVQVNRDTMRIEFANPAFRKMFQCESGEIKGRPVAEVLQNDIFERAAAAGGTWSGRGEAPALNVVYRAQIFPIEGEPLLAAVIVDISREAVARQEFERVREATLDRAQEVITRQMKTAQEIAGLLGETTAETKALLVKLMNLARQEKIE
ncbi:MAG: [Fe-Fe] hydrogenase large subunit C-terminal domain-containing protein [Candidatus Brocadiia bacterium]|jgi:Na+-translocating ferredoxin:NAD+ oxidoreductase RNF subunit RnfB